MDTNYKIIDKQQNTTGMQNMRSGQYAIIKSKDHNGRLVFCKSLLQGDDIFVLLTSGSTPAGDSLRIGSAYGIEVEILPPGTKIEITVGD